MTNESAELTTLLAGFEPVPSDGLPFITLDSQRRFYLNAATRKFIGIAPYERVALLYNEGSRAIAILRGKAADGQTVSAYHVDKRYYMSARKFVEQFRFKIADAPFTFVYDRGSSEGEAFIFRLVDR